MQINYLIINVIAMLLYALDKKRAKKHQYRIPEKTLILMAFLGGGIGSLIGMYAFHHKTSKWKFKILVPLGILIHILFIMCYLYPNGYWNMW